MWRFLLNFFLPIFFVELMVLKIFAENLNLYTSSSVDCYISTHYLLIKKLNLKKALSSDRYSLIILKS